MHIEFYVGYVKLEDKRVVHLGHLFNCLEERIVKSIPSKILFEVVLWDELKRCD